MVGIFSNPKQITQDQLGGINKQPNRKTATFYLSRKVRVVTPESSMADSDKLRVKPARDLVSRNLPSAPETQTRRDLSEKVQKATPQRSQEISFQDLHSKNQRTDTKDVETKIHVYSSNNWFAWIKSFFGATTTVDYEGETLYVQTSDLKMFKKLVGFEDSIKEVFDLVVGTTSRAAACHHNFKNCINDSNWEGALEELKNLEGAKTTPQQKGYASHLEKLNKSHDLLASEDVLPRLLTSNKDSNASELLVMLAKHSTDESKDCKTLKRIIEGLSENNNHSLVVRIWNEVLKHSPEITKSIDLHTIIKSAEAIKQDEVIEEVIAIIDPQITLESGKIVDCSDWAYSAVKYALINFLKAHKDDASKKKLEEGQILNAKVQFNDNQILTKVANDLYESYPEQLFYIDEGTKRLTYTNYASAKNIPAQEVKGLEDILNKIPLSVSEFQTQIRQIALKGYVFNGESAENVIRAMFERTKANGYDAESLKVMTEVLKSLLEVMSSNELEHALTDLMNAHLSKGNIDEASVLFEYVKLVADNFEDTYFDKKVFVSRGLSGLPDEQLLHLCDSIIERSKNTNNSRLKFDLSKCINSLVEFSSTKVNSQITHSLWNKLKTSSFVNTLKSQSFHDILKAAEDVKDTDAIKELIDIFKPNLQFEEGKAADCTGCARSAIEFALMNYLTSVYEDYNYNSELINQAVSGLQIKVDDEKILEGVSRYILNNSLRQKVTYDKDKRILIVNEFVSADEGFKKAQTLISEYILDQKTTSSDFIAIARKMKNEGVSADENLSRMILNKCFNIVKANTDDIKELLSLLVSSATDKKAIINGALSLLRSLCKEGKLEAASNLFVLLKEYSEHFDRAKTLETMREINQKAQEVSKNDALRLNKIEDELASFIPLSIDEDKIDVQGWTFRPLLNALKDVKSRLPSDENITIITGSQEDAEAIEKMYKEYDRSLFIQRDGVSLVVRIRDLEKDSKELNSQINRLHETEGKFASLRYKVSDDKYHDGIISLLQTARENQLEISPNNLSNLMDRYSKFEEPKRTERITALVAELTNQRYKPSIYGYSELLNALLKGDQANIKLAASLSTAILKSGILNSEEKVHDQYTLIKILARNLSENNLKEIDELLSALKESGHTSNISVISGFIKACIKENKFELAVKYFDKFPRLEALSIIDPTPATVSDVAKEAIDQALKANKYEEAFQIFKSYLDKAPPLGRAEVLVTAFMKALLERHQIGLVERLFNEIHNEELLLRLAHQIVTNMSSIDSNPLAQILVALNQKGIKLPDGYYTSVIKGCFEKDKSSLSFIDSFLRAVRKEDSNSRALFSLLKKTAQEVIESDVKAALTPKSKDPSKVSINQAYDTTIKMASSLMIKPSQEVYALLLKNLLNVKDVERGLSLFNNMKVDNVVPDKSFSCALIGLLLAQKDTAKALEIVQTLPKKYDTFNPIEDAQTIIISLLSCRKKQVRKEEIDAHQDAQKQATVELLNQLMPKNSQQTYIKDTCVKLIQDSLSQKNIWDAEVLINVLSEYGIHDESLYENLLKEYALSSDDKYKEHQKVILGKLQSHLDPKIAQKSVINVITDLIQVRQDALALKFVEAVSVEGFKLSKEDCEGITRVFVNFITEDSIPERSDFVQKYVWLTKFLEKQDKDVQQASITGILEEASRQYLNTKSDEDENFDALDRFLILMNVSKNLGLAPVSDEKLLEFVRASLRNSQKESVSPVEVLEKVYEALYFIKDKAPHFKLDEELSKSIMALASDTSVVRDLIRDIVQLDVIPFDVQIKNEIDLSPFSTDLACCVLEYWFRTAELHDMKQVRILIDGREKAEEISAYMSDVLPLFPLKKSSDDKDFKPIAVSLEDSHGRISFGASQAKVVLQLDETLPNEKEISEMYCRKIDACEGNISQVEKILRSIPVAKFKPGLDVLDAVTSQYVLNRSLSDEEEFSHPAADALSDFQEFLKLPETDAKVMAQALVRRSMIQDNAEDTCDLVCSLSASEGLSLPHALYLDLVDKYTKDGNEDIAREIWESSDISLTSHKINDISSWPQNAILWAVDDLSKQASRLIRDEQDATILQSSLPITMKLNMPDYDLISSKIEEVVSLYPQLTFNFDRAQAQCTIEKADVNAVARNLDKRLHKQLTESKAILPILQDMQSLHVPLSEQLMNKIVDACLSEESLESAAMIINLLAQGNSRSTLLQSLQDHLQSLKDVAGHKLYGKLLDICFACDDLSSSDDLINIILSELPLKDTTSDKSLAAKYAAYIEKCSANNKDDMALRLYEKASSFMPQLKQETYTKLIEAAGEQINLSLAQSLFNVSGISLQVDDSHYADARDLPLHTACFAIEKLLTGLDIGEPIRILMNSRISKNEIMRGATMKKLGDLIPSHSFDVIGENIIASKK